MNMKPNCHISTITKLYARGGREGRKSIAAIYAAFVGAHVFGDTCKEHLVGLGVMVTHTLQPIAVLMDHFIFLCYCILFIYVFIASWSQPVLVAQNIYVNINVAAVHHVFLIFSNLAGFIYIRRRPYLFNNG